MTASIINVQDEGLLHRVTYQFVDGDKVEGPFIVDRPPEENHQTWADSILPQPAVDYRAALLAALGEERFNALATALADEGVQMVSMGPAQLSVTASKSDPTDIKEAVASRVDQALGNGAFESISFILKSMGFPEAQLNFEPKAVIL